MSASSLAGFAHLDYSFTQHLSGTLGGRYTSEKKRISNPPGVVQVASNGDSRTFNNFSPMAALQYFSDQRTQVYASISQGFKSGGFNTSVLYPREHYQYFEPEQATSYELGLKVSRERFNLAGAVFLVNYDDIQISVLQGVEPKILNAAEAEIKGFEIEFVGAISTNLRTQVGVGYLDAKYTRLNPKDLEDLSIPITLDTRFMNAPKWSVNLGLTFQKQLSIGQLVISGDYAWRDKTYNDAINTAELVQPAYGLLHASVMLVSNDKHWQFSLFGNNLTDEEYIQSGLANETDLGIAIANYARPRQWGLSVSYRF